MSNTVAIYQDTPFGRLRVGTLTVRKHYSIRAVSDEFRRRHPNMSGQFLVARRFRMMGKWVDGEPIPMEISAGELKDPHERECAAAAIAARMEKATRSEKREWLKFRRAMLGH